MSTRRRRGLWGAYRPLLWLGLVGVAGLIAALIGDDWYDALSWLALGALVAIVTVKGVARRT